MIKINRSHRSLATLAIASLMVGAPACKTTNGRDSNILARPASDVKEEAAFQEMVKVLLSETVLESVVHTTRGLVPKYGDVSTALKDFQIFPAGHLKFQFKTRAESSIAKQTPVFQIMINSEGGDVGHVQPVDPGKSVVLNSAAAKQFAKTGGLLSDNFGEVVRLFEYTPNLEYEVGHINRQNAAYLLNELRKKFDNLSMSELSKIDSTAFQKQYADYNQGASIQLMNSLAAVIANGKVSTFDKVMSQLALKAKELEPTDAPISLQVVLFDGLDQLSKDPRSGVSAKENQRMIKLKSSNESITCTRRFRGDASSTTSCTLMIKDGAMKETANADSMAAFLYKVLNARASSGDPSQSDPVFANGSVRSVKVASVANRHEFLKCDASSGSSVLTIQKYSCEFIEPSR